MTKFSFLLQQIHVGLARTSNESWNNSIISVDFPIAVISNAFGCSFQWEQLVNIPIFHCEINSY